MANLASALLVPKGTFYTWNWWVKFLHIFKHDTCCQITSSGKILGVNVLHIALETVACKRAKLSLSLFHNCYSPSGITFF